jgi:hypothetical protein
MPLSAEAGGTARALDPIREGERAPLIRKTCKRGSTEAVAFSNTSDRKLPVALDRDDAEPETKGCSDKRRWAGRQLQYVCDHHDRSARQSCHSI